MEKNTNSRRTNANSNLIVSICYIWWIEMKNTIKDEGVLIFFILVPLFYPLLYSWIYNNEVVRNVPVVVVDQSHTATSRQFIRMFNASPDVEVACYCNSLPEAKTLLHNKMRMVLYTFRKTLSRHFTVDSKPMSAFIAT